MTGIPVKRVAQNESKRLVNMNDDMRESIINAGWNYEKITKAIQRNRGQVWRIRKTNWYFYRLGLQGSR